MNEIFQSLIEKTGHGFGLWEYSINPLRSMYINVTYNVLNLIYTFGADTSGNYCNYGIWFINK